MKIAVFGANGFIGQEVVSEAVSRGNEVDAYTRSGKAPEGVNSFALDFADTAEVIDVINNHDFTVISFASRDNFGAALKAHQALIAAAPTGRFLVVGGAGSLFAGEGKRIYETPDFPADYYEEGKTFSAVYDSYMAAGDSLKWTLLSPAPVIAPGARTGQYKVEENVPAGGFVSSQDLAVAILDEAEKPQHTSKRFTVASVDEAAAAGK